MNHPTPDEEIEALLGCLTPAAPPAELMQRLRHANPDAAKVIPLRRWAPLAAAAVIGIVASLLIGRPGKDSGGQAHVTPHPPTTADAEKIPVESRQHLLEVTDLGVVRNSGREPVRLIRSTWLDEISYETGPGSAPVKEARVRQEVTPVALTSY